MQNRQATYFMDSNKTKVEEAKTTVNIQEKSLSA
jgi:hypothetical protein